MTKREESALRKRSNQLQVHNTKLAYGRDKFRRDAFETKEENRKLRRLIGKLLRQTNHPTDQQRAAIAKLMKHLNIKQ